MLKIITEERQHDIDEMLEKAFKEGCEHGYRKAKRELEGYNDKARLGYKEGFEEKIEKLKEKYR